MPKISALPSAVTAAGVDDIALVQGGVTKQSNASVIATYMRSALTAGIYLGGTAAVNLLDDYEEGTWTPLDGGGTALPVFVARYTKIGNSVHIYLDATFPATNPTNAAKMGGLPFPATTTRSGSAVGFVSGYSGVLGLRTESGVSSALFQNLGTATDAVMGGVRVFISFIYETS